MLPVEISSLSRFLLIHLFFNKKWAGPLEPTLHIPVCYTKRALRPEARSETKTGNYFK